MAKKNFLMLSLEDSEIKKISNVISNDSCRKILDYLTENEATESELSKKLKIPLSTVHYNLQQLLEANLISADEYHYSKKGKEVLHYKLANKYIIIAPKKTTGIKEKLKSILPVALISLVGAGVIQFVSKFYKKTNLGINNFQDTALVAESAVAKRAVPQAANIVQEESADAAAGAIEAISDEAFAEPVAEAIPTAIEASKSEPSIALWFLVGALFAVLVYFLISLLKKE